MVFWQRLVCDNANRFKPSMRIPLHLAASFLLLLPPAESACPSNWGTARQPSWREWGSRCLFVPPERSTSLFRCVDLCAKDGGTPACIGSAEENDFVTAEFAASADGLWLGLYQNETRLGAAKVWDRCVAGDAPSFSNWDEDQSHDHLGYQQDCAWVDTRTGRWRDIVCVHLNPPPLDEVSCLCTRGNASATFAVDREALDTTCSTDEDCTGTQVSCNGNLYGNGVCGCWHWQGAALDNDGMCRIGSTWKATTHYALICTCFVGCTLVPLAYHTYATWLVVRLGAKGAVRTFAFSVELAMLAWMAATVLLLVWYGDPSLFGSRARQNYDMTVRTLWGPRTVSNTFTHMLRPSPTVWVWSVSTHSGSHVHSRPGLVQYGDGVPS